MNTALRTPLVLPLAAGVTVGLFLMMRALIDIGPVVFEEAPPPLQVEMNFEVPDEEPRGGRTMPDLGDIDPPPPVRPSEVERAVPEAGDEMARYDVPVLDTPDLRSNDVNFNRDGDPTPVVRINPSYPGRLADRGIEGQCDMMFDILPDGTTANVRALNCTNSGFERTSIRAIQRWRYNPQVRNGEPSTYRGARTQLIYALDT